MPRVIVDDVLYIQAPDQTGDVSAADFIFFCKDLDEDISIKGYLKKLLETLWEEGEGFSGKRPFGNSGWEYSLYAPLVAGGFVKGRLDADGYVDEVDKDAANQMIFDIIASL